VLADIPYEIVDYPGHPRLRAGAHSLIPRAHKIVYMIDSNDTASLKSVSENIFDIFTLDSLSPKTQFMICLNKCDIATSKDMEEILNIMNKEIESLRKSRPDDFVGIEGESFDIMIHAPVPMIIGAASVTKGKLDEVDKFLH